MTFLHLLGYCKCLPIPVNNILHKDRHEGSFFDKCKLFTAGRTGAWIFTITLAEGPPSVLIIHPFHFWVYIFHGRKFALQMGFVSFPLYGK